MLSEGPPMFARCDSCCSTSIPWNLTRTPLGRSASHGHNSKSEPSRRGVVHLPEQLLRHIRFIDPEAVLAEDAFMGQPHREKNMSHGLRLRWIAALTLLLLVA